MPLYENLYDQYSNMLGKKLKPILCPRCKGEYCSWGECEVCLRNRADNREWFQTHSFIADTTFESYHEGSHENWKATPLRLPHEHPFQFYGVEVEVEFDRDILYCGDDYDDDLSSVLEKASEISGGLFVYEMDSSLANGVEFISRPMSYAYWTDKDTVRRLREMFQYLRDRGALIDQPNTNGVHIHTSRKFYDVGADNEEQHRRYLNHDWVFQQFQDEMEQLCGRQYTHYCSSKRDKLKEELNRAISFSVSGVKDVKVSATIEKKGSLRVDDHSVAVNLRNHTIETRVFNSTTDYKTLLAYIELVRNVAHASRGKIEGRTLNDILHTTTNIYLDEHIARCGLNARKMKQPFNMEKVDTGEIEVKSE